MTARDERFYQRAWRPTLALVLGGALVAMIVSALRGGPSVSDTLTDTLRVVLLALVGSRGAEKAVHLWRSASGRNAGAGADPDPGERDVPTGGKE